MTTDIYFNKLEKWIDSNILHEANTLVQLLFEKELVMYEDIENYYKTYYREDFNDEEAYINVINDPEPQDVYEWYLVTKECYEKFSNIGDIVFKWENMHFWGRSCTGLPIIADFKYNEDRLKLFSL